MIEKTNQNETQDQDIVIDLAATEDAEAVAEILRKTWLATYPNKEAGITEEDIRLRTEGKNGERIAKNIENWRKRIDAKDGLGAVFVARANGRIVGMAGPGINEGKRRVGALYVLPEAQGRGVGSRLMQRLLEWHGDQDDIYLNAASYNEKAINFYRGFGFEQTKNPVVDEGNVYGNTHIPEIEMVRHSNL
jgi:GNAT superfamily N-acetyltransferase